MNLPLPTDAPIAAALKAARLARAAYGDHDQAWVTDGVYKALQVGTDSGFVLRQGNVAAIAIRGTDDLSDWIGNARQDWKEVAARFSILTDPILEPLLEIGNFTIYTVGHSRGGAIAQHLARLYPHPKFHTHCITFGTPRSCDDNTELPNAVSYCLPWDPVPMLPTWSRGRRDPAIRKYIFPEFIDDEDPLSLWRTAWNAASVAGIYAWEWRHLRWGSDNVAEWALSRHAMEHYESALEALQ